MNHVSAGAPPARMVTVASASHTEGSGGSPLRRAAGDGARLAHGGATDIHRAMGTLSSADSWVRTAMSPVRRRAPGWSSRWPGRPARSVRDDITQVASQFSYNAFLATVPFMFVLVSIIGLVAEPDTFDEFLADDADNAIPIELRQILPLGAGSATDNTGQAVLFLTIGL